MSDKLNWRQGEWSAPDGKKVPYYEANLLPLFQHIVVLDSILSTYGQEVTELSIRRWPKNTAVKMVIEDSGDDDDWDWDYTNDGEGDGIVPGHLRATVYTLLKVPTEEFDSNPMDVLKRVNQALVDFVPR